MKRALAKDANWPDFKQELSAINNMSLNQTKKWKNDISVYKGSMQKGMRIACPYLIMVLDSKNNK